MRRMLIAVMLEPFWYLNLIHSVDDKSFHQIVCTFTERFGESASVCDYGYYSLRRADQIQINCQEASSWNLQPMWFRIITAAV